LPPSDGSLSESREQGYISTTLGPYRAGYPYASRSTRQQSERITTSTATMVLGGREKNNRPV
jgi:hypothetical protein